MGTWIVWIIAAAVLGVAEILTTTFAFGLIALAALVGAVVGAGGVCVPRIPSMARNSRAALPAVRP
jgi:hypothetical protein